MEIEFIEVIAIEATPARIFDFTIAAENLHTFAGYGPIPGIVRATDHGGGPLGLGSKRDVEKSDGSVHLEELIVFDRPAKHVASISNLAAPLSWFVRGAEDDWRFRELATGATEVTRIFRFELTTVLAYPIAAPLIGVLLRRAVRRDLAHVKGLIERSR